MPLVYYYFSKLSDNYNDFFKRHGFWQEFDLYRYKPNPYWTAEENKTFRKLGNLERFGKWRPPGPFKAERYITDCGSIWFERDRFLYKNRPSPTDNVRRAEQWRWMHAGHGSAPVRALFYGGGTGFALYVIYFYGKKALSKDDGHHH